MRISKKQLLGFGGLALVAGITAFAYNLPTGAVSSGGDVEIIVQVFSKDFQTKIEAPEDGDSFVNSEVAFREVHSHAKQVKYYLTYVGEDGAADQRYELTDHQVDGEDVNGVTSFTLDLNNYGGFGTYIFESVITSMGDQPASDEVKFTYEAINVVEEEVTSDARGNATLNVEYASGIKSLGAVIVDKDGNVLSEEFKYVVSSPDVSGTQSIVIPVVSTGISSGSGYRIIVYGYDNVAGTGEPSGSDSARLIYSTPDAPNTPDTGSLLSALNISKSDFLITSLIGFGLVSLLALFIIKRANRK